MCDNGHTRKGHAWLMQLPRDIFELKKTCRRSSPVFQKLKMQLPSCKRVPAVDPSLQTFQPPRKFNNHECTPGS